MSETSEGLDHGRIVIRVHKSDLSEDVPGVIDCGHTTKSVPEGSEVTVWTCVNGCSHAVKHIVSHTESVVLGELSEE